MARRALSMKNRPRSLGLSFLVVIWLLMDRLQPPSWVWGMVGTNCAIYVVAGIVDFITAEDVELPPPK